MNASSVIYEYTDSAGRRKCIRACCGDICEVRDDVDVVVCSAFRNDYLPIDGTLIRALLDRKGISVQQLAQAPELDLRVLGGWISKELPGNFRRIACVELIDWSRREDFAYQRTVTLASAFTTMRFLLEQTANRGIPVRRVVMPLLGGGQQQIEACYLAVPLVKECLAALENIDGLQEIVFYDLEMDRVLQLKQAVNRLGSPASGSSQVFISYSTWNLAQAQQVRALLSERGVTCWMAPDSIPVGSSYVEEIPTALNGASAVALVLSAQAELSNWVCKEIGVAISRACPVLPFQISDYAVGQNFRFLLEGCQIFRSWEESEESRYRRYADLVAAKLLRNG